MELNDSMARKYTAFDKTKKSRIIRAFLCV